MDYFDRLVEICTSKLKEKNLSSVYSRRLELELGEIKKLGEAKYLMALYDKGIAANRNLFNLLVVWLLGICEDFDIDFEPTYTDPELPDIDCDFLKEVGDYLKEEFIVKRYGMENVCSVANYGTYQLKSVLIDIARIFGYNRGEIISLTKRLNLKEDDDGEPIDWDSALVVYKDLATYIDEKDREAAIEGRPSMAKACRKILSADIDWDVFGYKQPPHRIQKIGVHASGVIISGKPVYGFVPLIVPPRLRDKGAASAWAEGLAETFLQGVGLIKFDFLRLEANAKIAYCNKMIMERHGVKSICALPGRSTWSDKAYFNDPKCMEMANNADLKGIFQFDSVGIRNLVKKGGVSCFNDLAIYNAVYRPGVLSCVKVGTHIRTDKGEKPIQNLDNTKNKIAYINSKGEVNYTKKYLSVKTGIKKIVKITLKNGKIIYVSPEHKFLIKLSDGSKKYIEAKDLTKDLKLTLV